MKRPDETAPAPDAALLCHCRRFHAANSLRAAAVARVTATPPDKPSLGDAVQHVVQTVELAELVAATPAAGLTGILAKAKVLKASITAFDPGVKAPIILLTRSMAVDLRALSDAMLAELEADKREAVT